MTASFLATDLQSYGPLSTIRESVPLRQARKYCRQLTRQHFENFTFLLLSFPRFLRQHFCNLFAYYRWGKELADQVRDSKTSLALLDWWHHLLTECYAGRSSHPVFVALQETIRRFEIPRDPLAELLVAFRQDQQLARYESPDQLLIYCRYAANPWGRLILYLGGCHDQFRGSLADAICTGRCWLHICQNVAAAWARGRVYLPQTHLRRFGCSEATLSEQAMTDGFKRLIEAELAEAEGWLRRGLALVNYVPRWLQFVAALMVHEGLTQIEILRQSGFNVWSRSCRLTSLQKWQVMVKVWWQWRRGLLMKAAAS